MLELIIPKREWYDEVKEEFIYTQQYKLRLIHSLVSISKWEAKWEKAFLSKHKKTLEETLDYIRCMTVTQNIPDSAYGNLTANNVEDINEYIDARMSATVINNHDDNKGAGVNQVVTSEVIYHWMIALDIPFECQKWHLNRLLTLISVRNIKTQEPKKMSRSEILRRNKELNEERLEKLNTKG